MDEADEVEKGVLEEGEDDEKENEESRTNVGEKRRSIVDAAGDRKRSRRDSELGERDEVSRDLGKLELSTYILMYFIAFHCHVV